MRKAALFALWTVLGFSFVYAGEQDYTNRSFARLNFLSGKAFVQRATDLDFEEGIVNMPIAEGDRINTTDGRAEIFMGIGSFLRLDRGTKLDFQSLPRRTSELTRLQLWAGSTYISIRRLDKENTFEISTSDVSIYILDQGLYRIDVRENRETEIFVFRGMAEAAGEGGSVLLKSGERLEASQGYFPSGATPFTVTAADSFDRWSEYREDLLGHRLSQRYLSEELSDFEYELASQGRWMYMPPYGYVWIPSGMGLSWQPYRYGRWIWYPRAGWTWLPYESWGWVTCHYGRWHWHPISGWYWIPTSQWGPAWVSWHVGVDTYGWAPLTYSNRPAVIINNHFYADYAETDYPYRSKALTVVTKNQLSAPDISRVAIEKDSLSASSRIRLSRSAPAPEPTPMKMSIQPHAKDKMSRNVDETKTEKLPDSPRRIRTIKEIAPPSDKKSEVRSPSVISKIYTSITKHKDSDANSNSDSKSRKPRSEPSDTQDSTASRPTREPARSVRSVPKSSASKSPSSSQNSTSKSAAPRASVQSSRSASKNSSGTTKSTAAKSTRIKKKK